jgi:hypothetical protein
MTAKRRGGPRGLDFYVKWSVGNWAELVALRFCREVLSERLGVTAFRYGYSSGRIVRNLKEFEEVERERRKLEKFGKRPNLLLYDRRFAEERRSELEELVRKPDDEVTQLVGSTLAAAEVEMSLWSVKRARKKLSFTVKQEDVAPLERWRNRFRIPIIVFQVFMDELHFAPLDTILREGKLREDRTTKKLTYWYPIMREKSRLADIEDVEVEARLEFDEKGRLVVFPIISGGRFTNVNEDAIRRLGEMLKIGDRSVQGSA